MKMIDTSLEAFTQDLGSESPAPGGGAAAALVGALGAALTSMVCALTVTKAKYEELHALTAEVRAESDALEAKLLAGVDGDVEAFNVISAAYAMPKATDEEKAARSAASQQALIACTQPPLDVMEQAVRVLALTQKVMGKSNPAAVSDLGVSALCVKTAVQSAWLNVLINVKSMKDKELAERCRAKGEALLAQSVEQADAIYAQVQAELS